MNETMSVFLSVSDFMTVRLHVLTSWCVQTVSDRLPAPLLWNEPDYVKFPVCVWLHDCVRLHVLTSWCVLSVSDMQPAPSLCHEPDYVRLPACIRLHDCIRLHVLTSWYVPSVSDRLPALSWWHEPDYASLHFDTSSQHPTESPLLSGALLSSWKWIWMIHPWVLNERKATPQQQTREH